MATATSEGDTLARTRLRVTGTVQGVGFRPYVYRLATGLSLAGFVLNDSRGVLVEVEGRPEALREFERRLALDAPPLAVLDEVRAQKVGPIGATEFEILASSKNARPQAAVAVDTATCGDCLRELFDPTDRRFRYPFINCTNCGPRFTIVRGVPYDRPLTTMASFQMCQACRLEYENPLDRRFHAQPNACPDCGPQLTLVGRQAEPIAERDDALHAAVAILQQGGIVAVKGIGGFHLACLAADETAVAALRRRKHREDKPFAVMAPDLDAARTLVELEPGHEQLLSGPQRPIVIARRRHDAAIASSVAPGATDLGLMLPYSPLHHLLLADVGQPLVMTSGNVSDEPIAYEDEEALDRLREIADAFLLNDRPIETRTDDSVLRAVDGGPPIMVRRSRGYVPAELRLPTAAPSPLLACGAQLKSTFCLVKGERAWVSHHIGDLENYETLRSFVTGAAHFENLFDVAPELVVHDLHPDYLSTSYARDRPDAETLAVQHHHAHLAACLAEHGERGPAIGAIYDGTGYGTDGTIWGGELLLGDLQGFERVGHLLAVPLPGGEGAVREPWRMACTWITTALGQEAPAPAAIANAIDARSWRQMQRLTMSGLACPLTTSIGRLFDAVAALCGIRLQVNYEGQAAAELEAACHPTETAGYPLPLRGGAPMILDARPTIEALLGDLRRGVGVDRVAARFHNGLAAATAAACQRLAVQRGVQLIVLSGGCFQNRLLLQRIASQLRRAGLRVLIPERLPPGDGGISYGQAAIAAARLAMSEDRG